MELVTEIYLSDLTEETKDGLIENIIERIRDDEEELKAVENAVDEQLEEDKEFVDLKALTRADRIQMALEDKAKEILESTFFGEINIG